MDWMRAHIMKWTICATISFLLFSTVATAINVFEDQPRIQTENGHLMLISGRDRNITFKTSPNGYVNINGENLVLIAKKAKESIAKVQDIRNKVLTRMQQSLDSLSNTVMGSQGLQQKVLRIERNTRNNTSMPPAFNRRIIGMNRRITVLERQVRRLQTLLTTNECASNPCQNGGTCIDTYNGFFCLCPKSWEGLLCSADVNECAHFAGTDLGCQNGATCINRPGTYECVCAANWFGLHCTQRTDDCSSSSSEELCGHGTCVNTKASGGKSYKCICDQGWTTQGGTGPCTVDVNECNSNTHPACSVSPPVQCINVPGSFYCGACPQGFTGNGYYCVDIDECSTNNGGCSMNPMVQCINTQGSRICGQCPPGYQGDGKVCTYQGVCSINNGGCHPLATCVSNPRISDTYVECICPAGYVGSGMGPSGCVPSSSGGSIPNGDSALTPNPCAGVQCVHGTCMSTSTTTSRCICQPGYTGTRCELQVDPCLNAPCQNGGTCMRQGGGYVCTCARGFTGFNCENEEQSCGGVLSHLSGTLEFPSSGIGQYGGNLNCPWLIVTNTSKILQVNFTRFDLEDSPNCEYDFLQIHDGRTSGAHMLGRYCGNNKPPNITSTHNKLYLWFRSDSSHSREGFSLTWNSTDPVCGSYIQFTTHGILKSPGSPGRYPNNRDCYWTLEAPYGRRIQLHFFTMQIEASANCSNDVLEIQDFQYGSSGSVLRRYCNTSHPLPLTTPGHRAVVYFHSNDRVNDAGFQFSYTSVESFPGCGGVLSAPTGEVLSPNHPNTYRDGVTCEWHIQMPLNERIRLTFLSFSVESSPGCMYDYVEIRLGVDDTAPVVGRYCGEVIPSTYISPTNDLVIRFSSDYSISSDGFRIRYESLCGGEFGESSGIVRSPFYPNPYPQSRECIYEIALEAGQAVQLCFQDFEVEDTYAPPCRYDYLEIRDGHNENATLIGRYCGGQSQFPDCITSQYNYLWMKFKTDSSIQNKGFYANYCSIDIRCGGILKAENGTIQSPDFPLSYPDDHQCRWVIAGRPGTVVKLTWESFSLEGSAWSSSRKCYYDKVEVFDNSSTTGHGGLMGTYCGGTLPPVLITSDNTMTIVFTTDSSSSREGFSAKYTLLDASSLCGANYYTAKGSLTSPNYPGVYPHNRDCTWIISVPNGQQIKLNITDFDLEGGNRCIYDFLEIRNGGTILAPLMGKYCGTNIPRSIPSLSNQLLLHFKTDSSGRRRGFKITWDGTTTGCGGKLTSPSGSLISPNYPQPYGYSSECFWKISVSQGSVIHLVFVDLELEGPSCYHDFIEVYDGRDTSAKKLGRYCVNPPLLLKSTQNHLYIKFRSDSSFEGRGFYIRYETVCNTEVKGLTGVIESPNFPSNYPDGLDCTWNITAPKGNKINVTFSHFELESSNRYWYSPVQEQATNCDQDYLELKEGNGFSPPVAMLMEKKCGAVIPPPIHSNMDHVYVHFKTDVSRSALGFRLEWLIDGCGGFLRKPSGTFSSPNYPRVYPVNTECQWTIIVDWNHSIELTIKNFSMETTTNCNFDSLSLYSGTDDSGPLLHQFCHSNEQEEVFTSSGNSMFVRFATDYSISIKGFKASYRTVPIRCGGKFTTPTGSFHSPNYPNNYDKNEDCQWLIEVDKNHVVWLQFGDFDMYSSRNCEHDFVKIYDGNSTNNNTLLFHDCSSNMPSPSNFTSTGNQLLVHMRTSDYATAKGFRANYSIACGARIQAEDTGVISTSKRLIGEHNYNCSWIIAAANPEDHVTLTITIMELTPNWGTEESLCPYYFVEVRDGEDKDAPLIGTYCGSRAPPHITSQGSKMFVRAVSEYGHYGTFAATYSVLSSACGGNLSSEHGSFASPAYPNSYPREADCVWFVTTSAGNRVLLTFSMFELETSENCNEDYVEVRERDGMGTLLGVYCGTDIPSNLTASSSLWIKFHSSGTGTARGFLADYSLVHGNDLTGPTGQIASPLFPRPYIHAGQYFWRITVDNGQAIAITFHDFFIESYSEECHSSYLAVYDGYDETGPELLKSCGTNFPESITTSSNIAYIELNSQSYRIGSYFLLNWLQIERQVPGATIVTPSPSCGGIINLEVRQQNINNNNSLETYTLNSPGFPNGYGHNLDCEWIFETSPMNHLSIYFEAMDLETSEYCFSDNVQIYTGQEGKPDWKLQNTLCLPNTTYSRPIFTSNLMKVVFHTDFYANKTGFKAQVKIECGGSVLGPSGIIDMRSESSARHWVQHFPVQCAWNVTVRPGKTISVQFLYFNIPSHSVTHCGESSITLRNGLSKSSPYLGQGKYCGETFTDTLETTGNHLNIMFKALTSSVGFKMKYQEVSMACGNSYTLTGEEGVTISSPNYPNVPPPHTECEWVIMAPAGERIHIDFLERFDITPSPDCSKAFIEIRDGATINSEVIGKFCGSDKDKPSSQYTSGNMLYVRFYTDFTDPKNGFKAAITIDSCGGTLRGWQGRIMLPTYPGPYTSNMNCTWLIAGPPDHFLTIWFEDLNFPPIHPANNCTGRDSVSVSEMLLQNETVYWWRRLRRPTLISSSDEFPPSIRVSRSLSRRILPVSSTVQRLKENVIATYCESKEGSTPSFNTSTNEAVVKFQARGTSSSNIYRGFILHYNVSREACGGQLEGSSGEFQSPGYPTSTSYMRYCRWSIVVPVGRRVKLELLDFDFVNRIVEEYKHRLVVIDGSRSGTLKVFYANDTPSVVKSSGNKMTVFLASYHNVGHRGFKARYSSDEPAICGGTMNEETGILQPPSTLLNLTSYVCEWERTLEAEMNGTFIIRLINGSLGGTTEQCYYRSNSVAVYKSDQKYYPLKQFCGNNIQPTTVAYPFMNIWVVAYLRGQQNVTMDFTLQYSVARCGGMLSGPNDVITTPVGENGKYPPNSACVWSVVYPAGSVVNVTILSLKLHSRCENGDYLNIRNGPRSTSPLLKKYCGTDALPATILSETNSLWIEFYSDSSDEDQGITLKLEAVSEGCGNVFHTKGAILKTPKFPGNYPSNAECTWDIHATTGYTISLTFVERFEIEQTSGCVNDFVEVFDYVDDEYVSLGKYCGRTGPLPLNSTGSHMRVLFRSNSDVNNGGFKAVIDWKCGGVFNMRNGLLSSPGFPDVYDNNLRCNYTLIPPKTGNLFIEFQQFELEGVGSRCYYDWIDIYEDFPWRRDLVKEGRYCGTIPPAAKQIRTKTIIAFRTDSSVKRKGFLIKVSNDGCGGNITRPSIIQSPIFNGQYLGHHYCIWNITAPANKIVILRFSKFILEYSDRCYFDSVRVLDGDNLQATQLGTLCGNYSASPPILHSTGNKMVVLFNSDSSVHYRGFTASVLFQTACSRNIQVGNSPVVVSSASSEVFQSCQWLVLADSDKQIQMEITSFSPAPCNITNNTCSCTQIEIRDGPGPSSDLISRYCDGQISIVTSSSNRMWIHFITDSILGAGSFNARLTAVASPCGPRILNVTRTVKELTSPGYPNNYPANVRCRWTLVTPGYERFNVYFIDMNIEPNPTCSADFVSLETIPGGDIISEGLGQDLIFNGEKTQRSLYLGHAIGYATTKTTYCGNRLPADHVIEYNKLNIIFSSNGATQGKGFKLGYSLAGCNRNYTGVQGRIVLESSSENCVLTIQAPANHTISLYFISFYWGALDNCDISALEIRDGLTQSSAVLARLCGYQLPDPVFSSGNALSIYSPTNRHEHVHITYTTTDQGRGCGGQLFNYGGVFTSPMYPNSFRNNTVCRWDVTVPVGTKPIMHFKVFDLGGKSTCETDFVEIYDVNPEANEETFVARYCGEDNPANHEGSTNTISVRYTTSVHNGGTGWVVRFVAIKPGASVDFRTW